jgi:hypothetical protein
MSTGAYRAALAERLAPERMAQLDPGELMSLVAEICTDVELASVLHGTEEFFRERIRHFTERGYLTAQEDQGTRRLLALSYRPQLLHLLRRSGAPADGGPAGPETPTPEMRDGSSRRPEEG